MKNNPRKFALAVLVFITVPATIFAVFKNEVPHLSSIEQLHAFTTVSSFHAAQPAISVNSEDLKRYVSGAKKFQIALQSKNTIQKARLLAPFLDHQAKELRIAAAQELGAIESQQSLVPLKAKWRSVEKSYRIAQKQRIQRKGSADLRNQNQAAAALQLAIARVETRDLKGKARMLAVAQQLGLSFDDLKSLFRIVDEKYFRNFQTQSEDYIVVDGLIDMLESMAAKGEDISYFVKNWPMLPPQKARLEAASLPQEKRVPFLLDYLIRINALTEDNKQLAQRHLFKAGPNVHGLVISKLRDMVQHSEKYSDLNKGRRAGFYAIISAASMTKDPQVKPLLRKLIAGLPGKATSNKWLKSHAAGELYSMEHTKRIYIGRELVTIHGL